MPNGSESSAAKQTKKSVDSAAGGSRKARYEPQLYVALAALLLSLTLAAAGAFVTLRGSVVDVLEPREIIVYKNGRPENSLLAIAIQIPLINRSSSNDIVTSARLRIGALTHEFRSEHVTVTPVRFASGADTHSYCDRQGTGCVPLTMLAVVDSSDDVVIVPAGGAHALYYRFRIACPTSLPECARYQGGYLHGLDALADGPITVAIAVDLYADGEREIRCTIGPLNRDYIERNGWQSVRCAEPVISGNPLL